ncbi:MAG: hypothetical protein KA603_03430 [Azonexus sp.]|nr:hypothetical protein [Betaproteobacteria bacterium]MBK8919239.1 hypothetical protein [Betaproteobacteria bacterium]MBP6035168.1 hypothetical protein [Azonexus sp.]MBP6905751.1 hypothetical protein [Azonexus sp.]
MNAVGQLSVGARYAEGRLADLEVALQRPQVTRLYLGKPAAVVVETVPVLFSVCAQAQRRAAEAALAGAGDRILPPADPQPLWAEMLHEHLWRLLLDWPPALGLPQATEAFAIWRGARGGAGLRAATDRVLEGTLLGVAAAAWAGVAQAHSLAARCLGVLGQGPACAEFDFPSLHPADWLPYWKNPTLAAPPAEGPSTVAAAYRERLGAVVQAARSLASGAPYPVAMAGGAGWGVGQTLTARGVLTHGARLEAGRVVAYRVWAPTDRHFVDAAALAALVDGRRWPDEDAARRGLEQAVLALDPCLPHELKVSVSDA